MNILILANHFNSGGISSYVLNLARGLAAQGNKVWVGSCGGEWVSRLKDVGIEHICLPLKTKSVIHPKLLFAGSQLVNIIREKNIEVIHTQTRVTGWLAHWASKKTGVPYLSTAHGFFKRRWGRRFFACWGKRVIAISEQVKTHLIQDFKLKEEEIRLVHNGIQVTMSPGHQVTSHEKEKVKEKFGLKEGPVVGIIARLSLVKGHKYLITAMREVIQEIPNAQLLSIGDGSIKKDLENLANELKIRDRIHFVSTLANTREAFLAMDIFTMPSLQEGLGLAIMEAMANNVPVVASACGGIPTLVKHEQTGILVIPRNAPALAKAIIDLLKDKEKAARLAAEAKILVTREFSLEKMAQATEEVYQECVK